MNLQQILQEGFQLHQAGQLQAARDRYHDVLVQQPQHFDALHLSGVIAGQLGELDLALDLLSKACVLNPLDQAAKTNLAKAASDLGNHAVAVQYLQAVLQTNPDDSELSYALALNYFHAKDYRNAIHYFDLALRLRPNWAEAHCNRANALYESNRYVEALNDIDLAIKLNPQYAVAHFNRGNTLQKLNQLDEAQSSFEQAITLQPTLKQAHINLCQLHYQRGEYLAAYTTSNAALQIDARQASGYNCRGLAAMELGDYRTAQKDFEQAIAIQPNFVHAYTNLGKLLRYTNQQAAAIACYRQALAIDSNSAIAIFGLGLCELQIGDFFNGWTHYEARWHSDILANPDLARKFKQPAWDGTTSLVGKNILLHAEQGYGDTIQFCRYARLVKARGARVLLEVPAALFALFENLEGVDHLVRRGDTLPEFNYHCPLMSLPYALRFECAGIFALPPYLSVSEQQKEHWQRILNNTLSDQRKGVISNREENIHCKEKRKRIGLVWSGNPQFKNDVSRSLSLEKLIPYLPNRIDYICLQKEVSTADIAQLQTRPDIQLFSEQLRNFSDTAALCTELDLVVTVDTSVAHLASALGVPTIVLLATNSDWRWLLHHDKTPWYESVSLIRQTQAGQWDGALSVLQGKLLENIE
ncbi:tetratricopeptide repeat protein [Undibacterium sp. Di24W]|uniref:tetratricopeptide repeat protein n=1 Tax=Undibacterium sp. Di24W TaxID=3413033 RepID=UPI003BF0F45C